MLMLPHTSDRHLSREHVSARKLDYHEHAARHARGRRGLRGPAVEPAFEIDRIDSNIAA
jgi:hypothetical protein